MFCSGCVITLHGVFILQQLAVYLLDSLLVNGGVQPEPQAWKTARQLLAR